MKFEIIEYRPNFVDGSELKKTIIEVDEFPSINTLLNIRWIKDKVDEGEQLNLIRHPLQSFLQHEDGWGLAYINTMK